MRSKNASEAFLSLTVSHDPRKVPKKYLLIPTFCSRGLNPYTAPYTILDCDDIPVTPFDNGLALRQMTAAFLELGSRNPAFVHSTNPKPKLLTLGGDHSVALPALRALNKIYGGPIAVLHFDAHLDTVRHPWSVTYFME